MQICFPCTSCNKPLLVGDSASNTQVECPNCHRLVMVPDIREAVPALQALSSNLTTTIRPASQPPLPQVANNNNLPELNTEKTILVKLAPQIFSSIPESKPEVEEEPVLEVDLEPLVEEEDSLLEKAPPVEEVAPVAEEPRLSMEGDFSLEETEAVEPVSVEIIPDPAPPSEDKISGKGSENPSLILDEPLGIQPLEKYSPDSEEPGSHVRLRQTPSAKMDDFLYSTMLVEKPLEEESSVAVQVLPDLKTVKEGSITTTPGRVKESVLEAEQQHEDIFRVEPPPNVALTPAILEKEKDLHRLRQHLPSKQELREENRALKITSTGLVLVYWSIICFLLGILIQISNVILMAVVTSGALIQGTPPPPGGLFTILMLTGFVFQLLSGLLMVVGKLYCCWVPPSTNARVLIIISFCLDLGSMAQVSLAFALLNFATVIIPTLPAGTAMVLGLLVYASAMLMMLTSFVLFFLFLRAFAYYLDDQGTASEAWDIMMTWLALSVGWPLFVGVLALVSSVSFMVLMLLLVIIVLGSFWWIYLYLKQWIRLLHLIGSLRMVLAAQRGC